MASEGCQPSVWTHAALFGLAVIFLAWVSVDLVFLNKCRCSCADYDKNNAKTWAWIIFVAMILIIVGYMLNVERWERVNKTKQAVLSNYEQRNLSSGFNSGFVHSF